MRRWLAAALALTLASVCQPADARPLRVLSLDQCADQFALKLAPEAELTLSPRADDPDSWMRAEARGRRMARPGLEAALMARPDVAIRYWGGDPRLIAALERRGVAVIEIADAIDFEGVRANVRTAAKGLGKKGRGDDLIAAMDRRIAEARAKPKAGRALYLTPGGFTAGKGTLIDTILTAAGWINAAAVPGFAPVALESLILSPPRRFVLGFFEKRRNDRRGPGRHPVLREMADGRSVQVSGALLGCPAWFVGEAVEQASARP